MKNKSLTALVSAFARAYHSEINDVKIFDDSVARQLITEQEYNDIANNMAQNINVFQPGFSGTAEEALRYIVDSHLSPSPLGRAAFTEQLLENAVMLGAKQYIIFAAGYDTFAYRQPNWAKQLTIFELDHPATASDKQQRLSSIGWNRPANLYNIMVDFNSREWKEQLLQCSSFNQQYISFGSLLGISFYLTPANFKQMLGDIANIVPSGSSLVFDYPDEYTLTPDAGPRTKHVVMMASHAGEPFQASYSYSELEKLLEETGWLIYQHLSPAEITSQLFDNYNKNNPNHVIRAIENTNYCLAVKR